MSADSGYMVRQGEFIKPLDDGEKALSVSYFNGKVFIHLRKFFTHGDKKYPTKHGITLSRRAFEDLLAIAPEALIEFDRLRAEFQEPPIETRPCQLQRWPTLDAGLNWTYSDSFLPDMSSANTTFEQ